MERVKKFFKRVLKAYCESASLLCCPGTIPVRIDL